jgi:hypothetical protein
MGEYLNRLAIKSAYTKTTIMSSQRNPALAQATMISEIIDDRYAVLVFGDILNSGSQTAAQIVGDAWIAGGAPRVSHLDGCFSAVIINRATHEVVLIGRRRLSHYTHDRTLLVSPHDATLMATGHVPVEFDWISIESVVGWSGLSVRKASLNISPAIRWNIFDGVKDGLRRVSIPLLMSPNEYFQIIQKPFLHI